MLLNLYRYTEQARTDLLGALGALGNRLWVPHQVLTEFWANRETAIHNARSVGGADTPDLGEPRVAQRGGIRGHSLPDHRGR
ncbi:PIN-like domain-containing protein [Streptomyces sp. AC602_WCS936]|uniref:PIN-like domain-containing protein n=1 Tax=Streptomyces sp. AC602_WCS936 TaxID=2823685 RepID=UPI0035B11215